MTYYRSSQEAKEEVLLKALCNLSDEKLKDCGLPLDTRVIAAFMLSDYGFEDNDQDSSFSLDEINLKPALKRALKRAGIDSVNPLFRLSTADLLFLPGIGQERAYQIVKAVDEKRWYFIDKTLERL